MNPHGYETSLEKIYGARGIPKEDPFPKYQDNVLLMPLPDARGNRLAHPEVVLPPSISRNKSLAILDPGLEKQKKEYMDGPKHKVTVLKDDSTAVPKLYLTVFIQGPPGDSYGFADMFSRAKCSRANTLEEADLVVFAGGDDVNPALYGEKPHSTVSWNDDRDTADINAYLFCMETGIPMLGICRGAQFLSVMNGGKLYQHVDGHNGDHWIWDLNRRHRIGKISSVHHQMVMRNLKGGMEVIAVTTKAKERWIDDKTKAVIGKASEEGHGSDVEAFFYRETCCIGIQGHPEYKGYPEFTAWSLELVQELASCHPDTKMVKDPDTGKVQLRVRQDLLEERKARIFGAKEIKA